MKNATGQWSITRTKVHMPPEWPWWIVGNGCLYANWSLQLEILTNGMEWKASPKTEVKQSDIN